MARYALVVGIEEYDNQHLKALSKSVNDATDFAKLLENYGNCPRNQITLVQGRVTGKELIEAFNDFLNRKARNQEAIIYFSGHGVLEKEQDLLTKEVSLKGYLASSDCQLTKQGEQLIVQRNAIPLQSITKLINKTELSSLIFILDACHSGSLIQEIEKSFNIFQNNSTYYFLAACQAYEESWAKKSKTHSEFTGALLEALSQDKADEDGMITAGQAFDRASKQLETGRQKPIFLGSGDATG
ncbi:MAG: caspase family protein [Symploca sp. SIO2B6]|nr:caspase family protein [Symploca sp. SIO2B6]